MVLTNLGREWLSGEAGGGQELVSSSALGYGLAQNPGVLAPSMLLVFLGIRKLTQNIKQPMPLSPKRRKTPQKNSSSPRFVGAHAGKSFL